IFACNDLPAKEGDPSVRISMSKGVELRGFNFSQCWPSAIEIVDSEFITIAENHFEGSRYAIQVRERSTHHILVEKNVWEQSGGNVRVSKENAADFAGAFVGAQGISGDLIVRSNTIKNGHALLHLAKSKTAKFDYPAHNIYVHDNLIEDPATT